MACHNLYTVFLTLPKAGPGWQDLSPDQNPPNKVYRFTGFSVHFLFKTADGNTNLTYFFEVFFINRPFSKFHRLTYGLDAEVLSHIVTIFLRLFLLVQKNFAVSKNSNIS